MKAVEIGRNFTGYPNKKRREFVEGETLDLANDYADLIVGKGLARLTEASQPAPPAPDPVETPEGTDPDPAE